tara:strand:+ start:606 stop:914 length:309 start_codon:yes stop_codon:yes gene_type:complete
MTDRFVWVLTASISAAFNTGSSHGTVYTEWPIGLIAPCIGPNLTGLALSTITKAPALVIAMLIDDAVYTPITKFTRLAKRLEFVATCVVGRITCRAFTIYAF